MIRGNVEIVAAVGKNNELGKDNKLLWHLPQDFKRLKRMTMDNVIVMGRKTFESIGSKPLKGRTNIIVTRDKTFSSGFEGGCVIAYSAEDVIELADMLSQKIYIFGGAEIYKMFMPYVSTMHLTEVDGEFDADAFFPAFDKKEWELVSEEEATTETKEQYRYTFKEYRRK